MFPHSDTQTICVHSPHFVVHRKQKIIGLIIIVFLGIVAIGIFLLSASDQSSMFSVNDRAHNDGNLACGPILGDGIVLWTAVQRALKKEPINLNNDQQKELVQSVREQYNQKRVLEPPMVPMVNWNEFRGKMLLPCTQVDPQDFCIFAESMIKGCATYDPCKEKMESVTDMLERLMCDKCGKDPSIICSYSSIGSSQWPYVITDEGAGVNGDASRSANWVTESSNGRYLVRFWNKMVDRLPLSEGEVANWKSETYTYHYNEYWDIHRVDYYFGFLHDSPCIEINKKDETFVGNDDILCSVANAILWECHAITECKSELEFVREKLMNPDKPGKWCGFGWDKALENLNFCSTEKYPILDSEWSPANFVNLYDAFDDVLINGIVAFDDEYKLKRLMKKQYNKRYNFANNRRIYPKWDHFLDNLQADTVCNERNWCVFGDSVLCGCEAHEACRTTKKDELAQRLQDVLSLSCSIEYTACECWGPKSCNYAP